MSESAYNSPLLTRRLTESCCSSPARSIRSHNAEDMSDSESEGEVLVTEIPGSPDQTVISGWLKFRDNKKWKQRWGVITKLSPAADDNMIEFTLINCKFSIEKTKQYLDMYYTVRDLMPSIYRNIHPCRPESESIFKTCYSTILPKLTQSMYRILWMKYKEGNVNEMNMVKCTSNYSSNVQEIRLHEDLVMGDVHVFDFSNFKFSLSLQVTPTMLKNWAFISQNVMSNRLKAVHFLNLPPYLDKLVSVFKSFASKKIGDRLYFHQNIESLTKHIPLELLPSDYGGKQESLEVLSEMLIAKFYEYKDRFDKLEIMKVNEELRPEKLNNDDLLGYYGNFKQLDTD